MSWALGRQGQPEGTVGSALTPGAEIQAVTCVPPWWKVFFPCLDCFVGVYCGAFMVLGNLVSAWPEEKGFGSVSHFLITADVLHALSHTFEGFQQ